MFRKSLLTHPVPSSVVVSTSVSEMEPLDALQNTEQNLVLNAIDNLRSLGLDTELSLPQLVVCGDQSSGKSSVLEAIAEIPFPRKENLCTRFATEVILRRGDAETISCEIIPDKSRSEAEKAEIVQKAPKITSTQELPKIIDQVTDAIGLNDKSKGTRAFSRGILSHLHEDERPRHHLSRCKLRKRRWKWLT